MPLIELPIVIALAGAALAYNVYCSLQDCLQVTMNARKMKKQYDTYAPVSHGLDDNIDNITCSICIEELSSDSTIRKLNCGHAYHKQCIDRWWNFKHNRCPNCNANIM